MDRQKISSIPFLYFLCLLFILSCNGGSADKKIISDPRKMDAATTETIKDVLDDALERKGKIDDSTRLRLFSLVNNFYDNNEYANVWSHKEKWRPFTDTLLNFIKSCELYGLFPKHYHIKELGSLKTMLETDSMKRMDARLWTRADLLLTDAFMHLLKDIRVGRILPDSVLLNKSDTNNREDFYVSSLHTFIGNKQLTQLVNAAEPIHQGYQALKALLPSFLDSMDRKVYTYVNYPFKQGDEKDSVFFVRTITKRLQESGSIPPGIKMPDSTQLDAAIRKYQKRKGFRQDGLVSAPLVRALNFTDVERLKRIAITLDRYKQLPREMPEKYILVNLPTYYLKVWDNDTVALVSKTIIGKPETRTPALNSVISDMVTYPTWTVPTSIIRKQYLPKLKVNPNYLTRIGLHLVDSKGETVDPTTVNWNKYTKSIPFKVMQGSGDDNALGVLKFNFRNPYAVYLHDTNQRYLFKKSSRALSHGCVRVEKWEELAFYIARNDSMNLKPGDSLRYNTDSITTWLTNKEKKRITVRNGLPLFITYFSCEARGGKIRFYEDIYNDDKFLRDKYFSTN